MPGPYYIKRGTSEKTTNLIRFNNLDDSSTENIKVTNTNTLERVKPLKTVIDVVQDFVWTASPSKNTYAKIPTVYLTELEQQQNSLVTSASYYLRALSENAGELTSNTATYIINKITGADSGFVRGAEPAVSKVSGAVDRGVLETKLKSLANTIDKITSTSADKSILTDYLESYIGIYLTKPTGFQYALPYLQNDGYSVSNSWQNTQQVKPFFDFGVSRGVDYVDQAAATLNILQPGTYVERPKYFHYPTEGESVTVKFPLFNTMQKSGNIIPYQQNYELIWLLAFQNKPYRTSFSRILPSKLYTLSIPGQKFFPYCYLKSMDVDFIGTTRKLDVTLPIPSNTTIQAPIPEGYTVSLTFVSLLAETGNLMISEGFNNKIEVVTE